MILFRLLLPLLLFICLPLQANTTSQQSPHDPWENFNRSVYTFNDVVDRYLLQPVARGYKKIAPNFIDDGISNFFSNLDDILVTFNDLFQGKWQQGAMDSGRFIVNTTAGLLGLVDVASPLGLPKHNEDFGQTLGYWGVSSGPYIVLPFLGPSTVRDGGGILVDFAIDPNPERALVDSDGHLILFAVKIIDKRADLLPITDALQSSGSDPYLFVRESYLQRRNYLIYDGNPPLTNLEEDIFSMEPLSPMGPTSENIPNPQGNQ